MRPAADDRPRPASVRRGDEDGRPTAPSDDPERERVRDGGAPRDGGRLRRERPAGNRSPGTSAVGRTQRRTPAPDPAPAGGGEGEVEDRDQVLRAAADNRRQRAA